MSTGQTLYVLRILLKHISEHPEDARTVASGALSMLDGALKVEAEHDTKKRQAEDESTEESRDEIGSTETRRSSSVRYREAQGTSARRLGHPEDCRRDAGHRGYDSETLQRGGSAEG